MLLKATPLHTSQLARDEDPGRIPGGRLGVSEKKLQDLKTRLQAATHGGTEAREARGAEARGTGPNTATAVPLGSGAQTRGGGESQLTKKLYLLAPGSFSGRRVLNESQDNYHDHEQGQRPRPT